jgi:hypothetical protein
MKTVSFLMGGESYGEALAVASCDNPANLNQPQTSTSDAMNLLERIDIALQQARKSRGDLAEHIGVTVQHIQGLSRSSNRSLKPDAVAKAARFLNADVYWMCTGEGGRYVPDAQANRSFIAQEVARWIDEMTEAEKHKVFAAVYAIRHGKPFEVDKSAPPPPRPRA